MSGPLPLEPPEPPERSARAQTGGSGGFYDELMYTKASSRYVQTPYVLASSPAERQRVD